MTRVPARRPPRGQPRIEAQRAGTRTAGVLALQQSVGNQSVTRLLSRDTELAFNTARPRPVTLATLSQWVDERIDAGDGEHDLIPQLLSSHAFAGSDEARQHWAGVLRTTLFRGAWARRQEVAAARFRARTYEGSYAHDAGFFLARYEPKRDRLTVTVPIKFTFSGRGAGAEAWVKRFVAHVEALWSRHELRCRVPGWERITAQVGVKVQVLETVPAKSRAFTVSVHDDAVVHSHVRGGFVELGLNDLNLSEAGGSVAGHEFGHLLGLGDEYHDASRAGDASHSDLVLEEFGYPVRRAETRDDGFKDSIMFDASGRVLAEHGVVFLAAMARITGIADWDVRLR